jgi:hypothetical protein
MYSPQGGMPVPNGQQQIDPQALAAMLMSGGGQGGAPQPGMPTPSSVPMPQPPGMPPPGMMGDSAPMPQTALPPPAPPGAETVPGPMTPQQGAMQNMMGPPPQPTPLIGGQGAPLGPPGMRRF